MGFLKAGDTISGKEGRAYATINGNVEEMFYIKTLEAKAKKKKVEVDVLGERATQHKAAGWIGTGNMNIYYVTSLFRQMMIDYIKTGKDTYFDIQITNEDPTSSIGKQTIALTGVNLDEVTLAKLDVGAEVLDEDIAFTFSGSYPLDSFVAPTLG